MKKSSLTSATSPASRKVKSVLSTLKGSVLLGFLTTVTLSQSSSVSAMTISNLEEFIIQVGAGYEQDSNVFANSEELDDTILNGSLSGTYSNASGHIATSLSAGVDIERFSDFDDLDAELFNFSGMIESNTQNEGASFGISGEYVETSTAVAEEGTRVETNYITIGGYLEVPYSEKFAVRLNASHQTREAKTDGFEDQTVTTVQADWTYVFSQKIDITGSYRYRPSEVDNSGLESSDHAVFVGFNGTFSEKLIGELALGLQQRNFDGSDFEDQSAPFYGLSLQWLPADKTTVEISGSNDFDVSGSGLSSEVMTLGVMLTQDFSSQFAASVGIDYSDGTYTRSTAERDDQQTSFKARLDYYFANELGNLYLEGIFADRESDEDYFNYKRNRVKIGVDYSF